MTKRNDNAGSPLPQTKTGSNATLHDQLTTLDKALDQLLNSQALYHKAILALLQSGDNHSQSHIAGAISIHQWLEQSGSSLLQQLREVNHV